MNASLWNGMRPEGRGGALKAVALASAGLLAALPGAAWAGFAIAQGRLVEKDGSPFVMRGVNVAHAWYRDQTRQTFADVAQRGGNTVRVVLANGVQWARTPEAEVRNIIQWAKEKQLIVMLEVHDTTGYGEKAGAATLASAVDYWVSIKAALQGQEDHVLINLGNEPFGNGVSADTWTQAHQSAIQAMRTAGFTHTLVLDAANWGQDWEGIMRARSRSVFDSDPLANTLFSVHMYQVYGSEGAVADYLQAFGAAKLPLIVGEFAADHYGQTVAVEAILREAQARGVGYLGWSWSGNSSDLRSLDIVNHFDNQSLTPWGEKLFNSANGITATARKARIYSHNPALPQSPVVTAAAGNGQVVLSWPAVSGASSYDVSRGSQAGALSPLVTGVTATDYTDRGLANGSTYWYSVSARNAQGATASAPVSAKPAGTPPAPSLACSVSADPSNDWGSGQVLRLTLRNTGSAPLEGWGLQFTASAPFTLVNSWGAQLQLSGTKVQASPLSWNRTLPALGSVELGLQLSYSGSRPLPTQLSAQAGPQALSCALGSESGPARALHRPLNKGQLFH
jgi:mannan endo-1,4-beta-mannosidase